MQKWVSQHYVETPIFKGQIIPHETAFKKVILGTHWGIKRPKECESGS